MFYNLFTMLRFKLLAIFIPVIIALTIYTTPVSANALTQYVLCEEEIAELINAGEVVYARILSQDAYLFADADCIDKIFSLPYTYYVKLLEYGNEACRVMYCYEDYDYARGVIGYTKRENLTFVNTPPTGKSFPNSFLEFEGNGTFYKNNRFDSFYSATDTTTGADCFLYGYYTRGAERYCYVLHGGKLGYYSADVFKEFTLPTHGDPLPTIKEEPPPTDSTDYSPSNTGGVLSTDTGKAVFIAVSCIIAVCAVYLIFLPKKEAPASFEDEE